MFLLAGKIKVDYKYIKENLQSALVLEADRD